jgi:tetratricopeptide (TPR) repeat protein
MAEQIAWSEAKESDDFRLLQSFTAGYFGHLREAHALRQQSIESAKLAGSEEMMADWQIRGELLDAAFGKLPGVHQTAFLVARMKTLNQNAEVNGALVFALSGDTAKAEYFLEDLRGRFKQDTPVQSVVLPTVQAQLELDHGNPEQSIELLQTAVPYELTDKSFEGCMYPAYVRGQAYLAAKQPSRAAAEFQKILDHRGLVQNCETGALARLGVARAFALQGDKPKARAAYQDFLNLWKDADPDIPILKRAMAEYGKL